MQEPKRARRRRDKARMKKKAVRVFGRFYCDPAKSEKLADHMAVCSGWCCGNPRRWWNEPTMQERRWMEE